MQYEGRGRRGATGGATGEQVEGALRVGEHADRAGTAYVEGVEVTQLLEGGGASGDGGVEGLRVVGVQPQVDVGGERSGPGRSSTLRSARAWSSSSSARSGSW